MATIKANIPLDKGSMVLGVIQIFDIAENAIRESNELKRQLSDRQHFSSGTSALWREIHGTAARKPHVVGYVRKAGEKPGDRRNPQARLRLVRWFMQMGNHREDARPR